MVNFMKVIIFVVYVFKVYLFFGLIGLKLFFIIIDMYEDSK